MVIAQAMDSSSLKGIELGKLLLTSGLLDSSWSKISEMHTSSYQDKDSALEFKIYKEAKFTFVVFSAPPISINGSYTSSATLVPGPESEVTNPFHFLCSEKTPSFSLHTPAFELFNKNLPHIKSELLRPEKPVIFTEAPLKGSVESLSKLEKPVIFTGAALGGSVATLFTLWLLGTIDLKQPRPLCITFGSPFVGDAKLQQILENSVRNSCFLHVVVEAKNCMTEDYFKPFGTFLICFDYERICIEDPEAVMELLAGWRDSLHRLDQWICYGDVLHRLDQPPMADSRLMIDIIKRMKDRAEENKERFDQLKKLDDMKVSMAYIEWYKKKSKWDKIGYYDRFKTHIASPLSPFDVDVEKLKRELNDYWESMVEEVEKKPQSEKSVLKTRCLFAGNNFRRMVEPMDISEYYLKGKKEYRTTERPRRYVMLEKWFKAEVIEPDRCKNRDLSDLLTFDSCFWAEVEESLIVIRQLKTYVGMRDEALIGKLAIFKKYVWEMIGKREVSPEIFLEQSSFMKWWKEYKEIKGRRDGFDHLTEFMNTWEYENYGKPASNSSLTGQPN